MDKLPQQTPDLTQQNIDRIAELFPSAITETKDANGNLKKAINFTTLKQLLSADVVDGDECYEFTWVGKKQSIIEGNKPIRKTLRPAKDESKNWDTTENLYIEGDNLEVLKLLQNSYLGGIKMMYFDPPYNTGNDFVYRDNFAVSKEDYEDDLGVFDEKENRLFKNTETNGRYHSDWCSMMYPRLQLARNLLTDDGVIFISIDDNEVDNLKKICDEVFGAVNHIETIVWKNKYGAGAKTVGFISSHEYILCYSKNPILNLTCEFEGEEKEKYNKRDEKYDIRGPYRTQPLMTNSLGDRPNLMYSVFYKGIEIKPRKQWVWSKERMEKSIENNEVEFSLQNDGTYTIRSKSYLYDENGKLRRGKPVSILNGPFTQDGTKEMREIFDDKSIFDFTKPSKLIEYFLKLEINDNLNKDYVVLDIFSGSATTAHAVMKLNSEDGGQRKYVMVQYTEPCDEKSEAYKAGYKNICEIGKERIRRAGKKIEEELQAKSKGGGLFSEQEEVKTVDTGFRVLKLDETNMKDVYYSAGDYSQQMLLELESNIKEDRTDLDLLFGVMLDWGVPLSLPHITEVIGGKQVHFVNGTDLVACFEENITETVVREIAKRKPLRVVFRDSSFGSSPEKINVSEIFKTLSGDTTIKVI